jgi:hypothetical protein
LVRDPISVAKSFFSIQSIPGETQRGKKYLLDPKDKNNQIYLDIWDNLRTSGKNLSILKCLWYWYEIEKRIYYYKRKNDFIKWYRIETNQLNDLKCVERLFSYFDLKYNYDHLKSMVGNKLNRKRINKIFDVENGSFIKLNTFLLEEIYKKYGKIDFDIPIKKIT